MDHRSPRSPHFPSPTSPFVPPPSEQDEFDRLGAFQTKSTALHTKRSAGRPSDASSVSSGSAVSFPSSLPENLTIPSSSSSSSSLSSTPPPPLQRPASPSSPVASPTTKGNQKAVEKDTDRDSPVASSLFLVTEPQEESRTDLGDDSPTGRNAALGLSPSAGDDSSVSHPSASTSFLGLGLDSKSSPQPIIIPPLANQAPGSPHPPRTEPHQSSPSQTRSQNDLHSDSHDPDLSASHSPSVILPSSPPIKEPESHPIISSTDAFSQSQSDNPPSSLQSPPVADDGKHDEQIPAEFAPPPRTTDPDTSTAENPSQSPEIKIRDFAYSESNAFHRKPMEPRKNRASTSDGLEDESQSEGRAGGSRSKAAFGWGEFKHGGVDEEWEDESDYDDDDDRDEEDSQDGATVEGVHGGDEEEEEDCTPGLYKALYAFQSEAPSELSLSEGDLINVHRSGGIGWVIATLVSPNGDPVDPVQQGLVPRGYLRQVDRL